MKFSNASLLSSLLLISNASAFAPSPSLAPSTTSLRVAAEPPAPAAAQNLNENLIKYETDVNVQDDKWKIKESEVKEEIITDPKLRVQTGRYNDKEMSIALPFLKRPSQLDGTHAGDVGFDPLGLSESNDMYTMMEAEIRHSRLAMLAVIGWPLSELIGPNFMLHGKEHLAPSVLNGFDPLSFITVAAIFGGFGFFEYKTALRRNDDKALGIKHAEDMKNVWKYGVPGDYNFDPLNLYSAFGDDAAGRKAMRELEVAHGRSAMLGITGFAAIEALTGHQIVENNIFFHPNPVIPALALAYLAFGFFYEIENNEQYLLQVKMTSEGEVRKERIMNGLNYIQQDAAEQYEVVRPQVEGIFDTVVDAATNLKSSYDKATEDYTKSVMSKNYDM